MEKKVKNTKTSRRIAKLMLNKIKTEGRTFSFGGLAGLCSLLDMMQEEGEVTKAESENFMKLVYSKTVYTTWFIWRMHDWDERTYFLECLINRKKYKFKYLDYISIIMIEAVRQ